MNMHRNDRPKDHSGARHGHHGRPGIVNIMPEGVSLNHGAASVELIEPQASINDGVLEVRIGEVVS